MATIDLTKRGPAGIDGTAIASGHGNPRASFGVEGWLYVNLSSTALFRKENGVWVAKFFMKGLKGDAGKRGISLRSGSGAPSDEVGNPGDAYFNVLNGDVYGPKGSNGTWPASPVGSLRGPQGVQGIQGIQGNVGAQGLQGIPGTPGTSVSPLVYAQLNKILASANDIAACFIYDTRRDSDLGWWRFKCQGKSWYNETLGTATRGMRKEFPAVVAIIARVGRITIYDLTDLDGTGIPRLWAAYIRTGAYRGFTPITGVHAVNGRIFVTSDNGAVSGDLSVYDFPNDIHYFHDSAGKHTPRENGLNTVAYGLSATGVTTVASGAIVSNRCNAVHARAIAGSPKDAAGLDVPTVGVVTAAGTSVVTSGGSVWDITGSGHSKVQFASDTEIQIAFLHALQVGPIPTADVADSAWRRDYIDAGTSVPKWGSGATAVNALTRGAAGFASGLFLTFLSTSGALDTSSIVKIGTAFNTGHMPGDTRGAYICDGVTGNLVGANVYSNDGTDTTGFTALNSGVLTTSGGALVVTDGGVNNAGARRSITGLTIGQAYRVSAKIKKGAIGTQVRLDFGGVVSLMITNATSFTPFETQIIATATSHNLDLYALGTGGSGNSAEFDDISIDVAVPDRSSKAMPLRVVGTLSRTAVNTGNDLVALSGFSAANYLEQPYNSDLDFTGDFSGSLWVNTTDTNAVILERAYYTGGAYSSSPGFRLLMVAGALSFRTSPDGFATLRNSGSSPEINDGSWHLVTFCRRGTTLELWVDGVLVTSATVTVDNLTNSNAMMRVGIEFAGTLSFAPGSVALLRLSAYPPTAAQIAKMFADERPLFDLGAKAFLGGASNDVRAIDYDPDHEVHAVATADGVSEFRGLRRFNYWDTTNCALTNDNMKCVSRRDGFRLYGGGADIIANRDLSFTADDAAMRAAYLRTLIPDTSLLATSAALAALSATVAGITVPVKGAGTDYWTGTDDAKFMTAKALRDAGALVPIASAATINLNGNSGLVFDLVLDHNASFALPTNLKNGETYTIIITQGTTGGTGAFNGAYDFRGVTPTLSVGAGKIDIVRGVYKASSGKLISSFSKAV